MNLCSTCHFYEDTLPNLLLGTCHEPPGGVRTARGSWCSRWRANGVVTQEDVNKVRQGTEQYGTNPDLKKAVDAGKELNLIQRSKLNKAK